MRRIKRLAKNALSRVGLLQPALGVYRGAAQMALPMTSRLAASGFLPWKALVPEQAFSACAAASIRLLRERGHTFGDYLEFGVSRGTSLACMSQALASEGLPDVRMIGFDSFEGMPPEAAKEGWRPGEFASTEPATRAYLESRGARMNRIELVCGWFTHTLNAATVERLALRKASVIMIDCDIYSATCDALSFCEPLIGDAAVLLFDDWGWTVARGQIGQREAFEEFLIAHPSLDAAPLDSYFEHARVFLVTRRPH